MKTRTQLQYLQQLFTHIPSNWCEGVRLTLMRESCCEQMLLILPYASREAHTAERYNVKRFDFIWVIREICT